MLEKQVEKYANEIIEGLVQRGVFVHPNSIFFKGHEAIQTFLKEKVREIEKEVMEEAEQEAIWESMGDDL